MAVDESTVSQAPGQPDPDNVEVKIEPPPLPDPSTYPDVEFVYNEIVGSDPKELGSGPPIHFEGAEHERIASELILKDIYGTEIVPGNHELWNVVCKKTGEELKFTFGRIIALSGDHYTNASDKDRSPICGAFYNTPTDAQSMEDRFSSMVDSFKDDRDGYLKKLNNLIAEECNAVDAQKKANGSAKQAYHEHICGIPTDSSFFYATAGLYPLLSLYTWAASINADHFGEDAVTAYAVGHGKALKLARAAAEAKNDDVKHKMLMEAYLYEAFAAHFLTDLFSAGHIRAPRRQFHCTDTKVMALSIGKHPIDLITGHTNEVPIWDHQNRYMHDDDSATGILVQNKKGHQWIAYGDKQFLENGNAINRRRVQRTLQVSVSEVYDAGFSNSQAPLPGKDDYAALQLIPQPMIAIKDAAWQSSWDGHDIHNPAPLWLSMTHQEPESPHWTRRTNLNDHSDFRRVQGHPGYKSTTLKFPTETPEGRETKAAPFRGDDQYMWGGSMGPLLTGGFLQIQDLNPESENDSTARTCINVWSPVRVTVAINEEPAESFTIRNRIFDVPGAAPVTRFPLHWTKWIADDGTTSLVKFEMLKEGSDIVVSRYGMDGSKKQLPDVFDTQPDGWEVKLSANAPEINGNVVLPGNPDAVMDRQKNLVRFLLGCYTEGASKSNPDIAVVSFDSTDAVRVALSSTKDGMSAVSSPQIRSWEKKLAPVTFIKRFVHKKGKPESIAAISLSKSTPTGVALDVDIFSAEQGDGMKLKSFSAKSPKTSNHLSGVSALVGDIFGTGNDEIALISTPESAKQVITVYGFNSERTDLQCHGSHQCKMMPTSQTMTLIRPYLTALIPALPMTDQPRKGLDIVTISLYKDTSNPEMGPYFLIFRTHRRGDNADEKTSTTNPWQVCKESPRIEDKLYETGAAYKHIKWLRCQTAKNSSSIMEIYSYYGVLGVRHFRQQANGTFVLQGQTPYLGQTSIGAGRGAHKDWGHGFQTWGDNKDFEDENLWTPAVGSKETTSGGWGFGVDDAKRRHARGWEVDASGEW